MASTRRDPVTPDVHAAVVRRDGGCVAMLLAASDGCRNAWGYPVPLTEMVRGIGIELDHVKDQPAMGVRAPSDPAHLVALCHHHHQGGWATRNRPLLRSYLAIVTTTNDARVAASAALHLFRRDTGKVTT